MPTQGFLLSAAVAIAAGVVTQAPAPDVKSEMMSCTLKEHGASAPRVIGPSACPLSDNEDTQTIVSCDFTNAEPVDIKLGDFCKPGAIARESAKEGRVQVGGLGPVQVDWLAGGPKSVHVMASRILTGEEIRLLVADRESRYLRFTFPDSSPITLSAAAILKASPLTLQPVRGGGEVFALVQEAPVLPDLFILTGPVILQLAPKQGAIETQGVPPGHYVMTPMYAGGLPGRARPVPVQAGRSSAWVIVPESVGAVNAVVADDTCGAATSLRITRLTSFNSPDGGVTSTSSEVFRRNLHGPPCSERIAGLAPSAYELAYLSSTGTVATARVQVGPQTEVTAQVRGSGNRVTGVVTLNDKPAAAVTLRFSPADSVALQPLSTQTDGSGSYDIQLPEPGSYNLSFSQDDFVYVGNDRSVAVSPGFNERDWQLTGGRVKVNVLGADGPGPVAIALKAETPRRPGLVVSGGAFTLDRFPIIIAGIAEGDYSIQGSQRGLDGTNTTDGVRVHVDGENEHTVTLNLKARRTVVFVVDVDGNPVDAATVVANQLNTVSIGPGRFAVDAAVPGSHVLVSAPGFVPLCRLLPSDASVTYKMETGIALEIDFVGRNLPTFPLGRLVPSDSECPVALQNAQFSLLSQSTDEVRFLIQHFPITATHLILGAFDTPDQWLAIRPVSGRAIRVNVPTTR